MLARQFKLGHTDCSGMTHWQSASVGSDAPTPTATQSGMTWEKVGAMIDKKWSRTSLIALFHGRAIAKVHGQCKITSCVGMNSHAV